MLSNLIIKISVRQNAVGNLYPTIKKFFTKALFKIMSSPTKNFVSPENDTPKKQRPASSSLSLKTVSKKGSDRNQLSSVCLKKVKERKSLFHYNLVPQTLCQKNKRLKLTVLCQDETSQRKKSVSFKRCPANWSGKPATIHPARCFTQNLLTK